MKNSSCSAGEGVFRGILLGATERFVPRGNIPNMIPNLSESTNYLIRERNSICAQTLTDLRLPLLNQQIEDDINATNWRTWIDRVESCSHKHNTSTFFALINELNVERTNAAANQPILLNQSILTRDGDIARVLKKQFSIFFQYTNLYTM